MSNESNHDWKIGNAFDLMEEARYKFEELAMPKLRAFAMSLQEPKRGELLRLRREDIGYPMGLVRSARAWLGQVVPRQDCVQEGHHLRYKPLIEPPKTLPR